MSPSSNKRKFPRVEGKGVAAYLRLNGNNAGCTVQNISVGGIFVRTDRFLPVGTKLAFDLVKPGMKKALTVSGWVVGVITADQAARSGLPQGLRIQFAKLVPGASEALQEMVGSLRRNAGAEPPVLYPLEPEPGERMPSRGRAPEGTGRASRPGSSPSRSPGPPPARAPSRALGDAPPDRTEVEMEARDARSRDPGMIDDSLLDSTGEPDFPEQGAGDGDRDDGQELEDELGPNPFDDEDRTAGVDPTQVKARFDERAGARRPHAARGDAPPGLADLESTNRELQRLLERHEAEIASLRAQTAKLEQTLREREEQLALARRVLKANGLG